MNIKMGQLLRVPLPKRPEERTVDALPNFYHLTRANDGTISQLDAGINGIAPVGKLRRRPGILIRSSPHKAGTEVTPWQDRFEPDRGYIRYFGDNKYDSGYQAHEAPGNKLLLAVRDQHNSPLEADRMAAPPLMFFQGTRHEGAAKGHVRFWGVGVVQRAELVTQLDPRTRAPFTNYLFDFLVMSLAEEDEEFSWEWINVRRDAGSDNARCMELAPQAWRVWVKDGPDAAARVRRRVSALRTAKPEQQIPEKGSRDAVLLRQIYERYTGRKTEFEALGAFVAARLLGSSYRHGWITRGSGDEGVDFVGRLDVGEGFSTAKLVVLGQAKCEKPDSATGGVHVARTIARLRRGWVGVYVTTSYFSPHVQREVFEDRCPILLVPGNRIVEVVNELMLEKRSDDLDQVLSAIEIQYERQVDARDPEEVLFET